MDLATNFSLWKRGQSLCLQRPQMLQYWHKQVFTTFYKFDFQSEISLWRRPENKRKKESNARRQTGFPGSETHNNFFFVHWALYIFMFFFMLTRQCKKKPTTTTLFCSLGITLLRSHILFLYNAHNSAVSDAHTRHYGLWSPLVC